MPSWTQPGKKLEDRTKSELVQWIILCPLVGAAMVVFAVVMAWKRGVADEWFGLAWMLVVGTIIAIGPPAVARKELRRRKQ